MSLMKGKSLNKFTQSDIDEAVEEFNDVIDILPLIYKDILEITLPKYSEKAKQFLHSGITENIEKIESSIAFDIFIEIYGLNYVLSKTRPKFLDVFEGLDSTCNPTLPWQYFSGTLYTESKEKEYCDLNGSKRVKAQTTDFERIIKITPNEFFVLLKRMQDPTISARAFELLTIYTRISLAEDWGFKIENYKVENSSVDLTKNDLSLPELKKIVLDRLKNLYDEFSKLIDRDSFLEPQDNSLKWENLKVQCELFKNQIINFRSRNLKIVSNFNLAQKKLFCFELRDLLAINQENTLKAPSSTNLNKLINGAGLLKKIGKLPGGYKVFVEDYKKWIIEMIDTEQKIIGPTSLKDQSRAENLN